MRSAIAEIHQRQSARRTGPQLVDWQPVFADLALLATCCAVVGLFALSPLTLEAGGIAYISSGGGLLAKVHPSTPLAGIALALRCLASRHPFASAWRLGTTDAGPLLLLCAFAVTAVYAVGISHTPITPLIDTFVLPVMIFLSLRDLDAAIARKLAIVVGLVFCANAVIAILEFSGHWRLFSIPMPEGVTSDPRRADATFDWRAALAHDWRSTALMGHPLTNGLATGAFILCLTAAGTRWIPTFVKAPAAALQALAMLAFGARTAVVLTIILGLWLAGGRFLAVVRCGRRVTPKQIGLLLVVLAVCMLVVAILAESGFADQTLERFQHDQGSATTRITMFHLFDAFTWSDILLGPAPDVLATQQRLEGLEFGIESSWIGLALGYGVVVLAIHLTGIAAFTRSLVKASGPGAGVVMLFFFIQVSTAASLSTKTTIFAMTVAIILLFLRRDTGGDAYGLNRPGAA